MKYIKSLVTGIASLSLLGSSLSAETGSAEISSFMSAPDFSLVSSDVSFRFSELAGPDTTNSSTHILIDGLVPVSDGSSVVTSNYRGVNINDGSVQDVGRVYLTLPAQSTSSGVSSPIVGIVARSGGWEGYTTASASSSTVGDSSGSVTYDSGNGSISFSLSRGGETFTGSTTYTVVDDMTIEIGDLTLSDGSSSYDFYSSVLYYSGTSFYGVLDSTDSAASYDSLMFSVNLSDLPDVDSDSIPDISDPSVEASGGLDIVAGEWRENAGTLGWLYGASSEWGQSFVYGYVYGGEFPWIYIHNYGWAYFHSRAGSTVYLYSPVDGWLYVGDSTGGWFQYDNGGTFVWDNFLDRQR